MAARTSRRSGRGETEWHGRVAYPTHAAPSCVCYGRTKGTARIDLGSGTSSRCGVIVIIIIVTLHTGCAVSDYAYGPRASSETNSVAIA